MKTSFQQVRPQHSAVLLCITKGADNQKTFRVRKKTIVLPCSLTDWFRKEICVAVRGRNSIFHIGLWLAQMTAVSGANDRGQLGKLPRSFYWFTAVICPKNIIVSVFCVKAKARRAMIGGWGFVWELVPKENHKRKSSMADAIFAFMLSLLSLFFHQSTAPSPNRFPSSRKTRRIDVMTQNW